MAEDTNDKLHELEKTVTEITQEIKEIKSQIHMAFPKSNGVLGETDLVRHKIFHEEFSKKTEKDKESNLQLRRNIISWVIIGVLSVVAGALTQVYLPIRK